MHALGLEFMGGFSKESISGLALKGPLGGFKH
jgi:hypothetical protein